MLEDYEFLLNVILPFLGPIVVGILMFWLGSKQRNVAILADLEDISAGLAEQLKESRRTEVMLRVGIVKLIRQIEANGEEPVWRPNGYGQTLTKK